MSDKTTCEFCQKTFPCISKLNGHRIIHTGEKPFRCSFCPKTFNVKQNAKSHEKVHAEKVMVKCKLCNKEYASDRLKCHLTRHARQERRFQCNICSKRFKELRVLNVHLKHYHDQGVSNPFECIFCKRTFGTRGVFEQHLLCKIKERPHMCTVCPEEFSKKYSLHVHRMVRHSAPTERHFQCKECTKLFWTASGLSSHSKVHSDVTPYQCGQCERAFKSKEGLNYHSRHHDPTYKKEKRTRPERTPYHHIDVETGKRVYRCGLCEKDLSSSRNLEHHMQWHLREKPYTCALCQNSYSREELLKDHIHFRHTKERHYKCRYCDHSFVDTSSRRAHEIKEHK